MSVTNIDIEKLLLQIRTIMEPRSIAIIGASGNIEKVGGAITRNALESNYVGKIYLVNPNIHQIFGRKTYSNLEDIPNNVDLVEIIVSAPIVPIIMEQVARKGVKGVVIISSGFAEIGNENLQAHIIRIAKEAEIRVIGPNCFGIINTDISLDLTFTFSKALPGSVAFVSQSGAMCCGTLDWAYKEEMGFSKFINLGNKCDVDESDVLMYLLEDQQTRIIAMHIEGITDGRKLFETIRLVSKRKPIIVLKAGITEPGARAALSHTGSIVGSTEIVKVALKQAGAIVVEDIEELFDAMQTLTQLQVKGKNVAILSNAGGLGVMVTDWCHRLGLKIPRLPDQTLEELKSFLLPIASPSNPIDMTGSADYECYKYVINVISKIETIDLIISIFVSQGLVTSEGPTKAILEKSRDCKKPILVYMLGGNSIINSVKILKRGGIPVYSSPVKVAKAAAILVTYSNYMRKMRCLP